LTEAVDLALAALADPRRRRAVELLRERPHAAGELARAVRLQPPAMSRHLRVLRESGLVEESHGGPDARVRVYRLRPERLSELAGWIAQLEAGWGEQLAAFKAHVERPPPEGGG
jgi:DNA-binding transcriptional ArsR family regulator